MRSFSICFSLLLLGCAILSATARADGKAYLYDADGKIVRNNNGECLRTAFWTPAVRQECDPEVLIRPRSYFPAWPVPYIAAIPAAAAVSEPAAPGVIDRVMGSLESSLPPREELDPASKLAAPADGSSSPPEDGMTKQAGTNAVAAGTTPLPAGTAVAASPSGDTATPPDASHTPEWMKEAAKKKEPPKPARKPPLPYQVIIALIFDVLAIAAKFAHLW